VLTLESNVTQYAAQNIFSRLNATNTNASAISMTLQVLLLHHSWY
jgi:hypothetical protein